MFILEFSNAEDNQNEQTTDNQQNKGENSHHDLLLSKALWGFSVLVGGSRLSVGGGNDR